MSGFIRGKPVNLGNLAKKIKCKVVGKRSEWINGLFESQIISLKEA
jgi:hypothetical protein